MCWCVSSSLWGHPFLWFQHGTGTAARSERQWFARSEAIFLVSLGRWHCVLSHWARHTQPLSGRDLFCKLTVPQPILVPQWTCLAASKPIQGSVKAHETSSLRGLTGYFQHNRPALLLWKLAAALWFEGRAQMETTGKQSCRSGVSWAAGEGMQNPALQWDMSVPTSHGSEPTSLSHTELRLAPCPLTN